MAEFPKISISNNIQHFQSVPKPKSKLEFALKLFLNATGSDAYKILCYTAKVNAFAFGLRKNLANNEGLEAAKEASKIASTVKGVISLFSSIRSLVYIIKLAKNPKKDITTSLKTTNHCIKIINSFNSFLGILDRFNVIELAKITEKMGKIPLIGKGLARAFPTSVVFSLFSLASSSISLVISSVKIHKIRKELKIGDISERSNHRLALVKASFKIAFSILSITLTIVSIALIIIFPATIPLIATIALSLIGIIISTASLIKTIAFKRIKPKIVNSSTAPNIKSLLK